MQEKYLKIGIGTDADATFEKVEDLKAWFKGKGSTENRSEFTEFIKQLIPSLKHCKDCIATLVSLPKLKVDCQL